MRTKTFSNLEDRMKNIFNITESIYDVSSQLFINPTQLHFNIDTEHLHLLYQTICLQEELNLKSTSEVNFNKIKRKYTDNLLETRILYEFNNNINNKQVKKNNYYKIPKFSSFTGIEILLLPNKFLILRLKNIETHNTNYPNLEQWTYYLEQSYLKLLEFKLKIC